jgi:RNA polymerase sigma factor (sigma-70 family)
MQVALEKRKLSKAQKNELVITYQKLVRKIANGYARRSTDPVEDLIQVGLIGLLEAAENFKEFHKTLFQTYAVHYISGHIRHYLRDKQNLMKGPRALQELSYRMSQTIKELTQKLGRDPNNEEISSELSISANRIDEVRTYERRISVVWLDQVMSYDNSEDDNRTRMEMLIENKGSNDPNEQVEEKILLREAIKKLGPKEQELLELRYFKDMTQVELSNMLGISQMEVCRKLKKAEKELKLLISKS